MNNKDLALLLFEISICSTIAFVLLFVWCYFRYWKRR